MVERICSETVLFLFVLLFKLFIQDVENIRFFVSTLFLQPCPRKKSFCAPFAPRKEDRQPCPETEQRGTTIDAIRDKRSKGKTSKGRTVLSIFYSLDVSSLHPIDDVAGRFCFFSFHIISVEMLFRIKTSEMGFKVRKIASFHLTCPFYPLKSFSSRDGISIRDLITFSSLLCPLQCKQSGQSFQTK